jgi:hypothetical protein
MKPETKNRKKVGIFLRRKILKKNKITGAYKPI